MIKDLQILVVEQNENDKKYITEKSITEKFIIYIIKKNLMSNLIPDGRYIFVFPVSIGLSSPTQISQNFLMRQNNIVGMYKTLNMSVIPQECIWTIKNSQLINIDSVGGGTVYYMTNNLQAMSTNPVDGIKINFTTDNIPATPPKTFYEDNPSLNVSSLNVTNQSSGEILSADMININGWINVSSALKWTLKGNLSPNWTGWKISPANSNNIFGLVKTTQPNGLYQLGINNQCLFNDLKFRPCDFSDNDTSGSSDITHSNRQTPDPLSLWRYDIDSKHLSAPSGRYKASTQMLFQPLKPELSPLDTRQSFCHDYEEPCIPYHMADEEKNINLFLYLTWGLKDFFIMTL
jgi:hypothetical protein